MPENFRYFTGIEIIDPNRPGPDKTRPVTDPENYRYLYGSKLLGPERPGSDKARSEPDPKTRMPRPALSQQQVTVLCEVHLLRFPNLLR